MPLERITDFGTDADNQAAVDIRVMSGERDSTDPLDCQEVGLATLNLPEQLPARSPIRVKFAINQDGRLSVSAIDLTGGGSIDVEFQTEAVMNAEEVAERSTALIPSPENSRAPVPRIVSIGQDRLGVGITPGA